MTNSIQSIAMTKAWEIFKRKGERTMEAWSKALKMGWVLAKMQKRNQEEEIFEPMSYLKENRDWIIREIMKYNSRSQLIDCMTAVKEAVLQCSDIDEAEEKVTDIAMLRNFDIREFEEANMRRVRERAAYVLG